MANYVIIAPLDSLLTDKDISETFDTFLAIYPGRAWALSTSLPTCAEVRDKLRPPEDASKVGKTCVVVKATEYNGYAKKEIWEKMEAWERK